MLIASDVVATTALNVLSGYCGNASSAVSRRYAWSRHFLRHLNEDPHLMHVGNAKELRPVAGAAAGIDQRADIGIARGHDAVERSDDALEGFERGELIDLALVDIGLGQGCLVARTALPDSAFLDSVSCSETTPFGESRQRA